MDEYSDIKIIKIKRKLPNRFIIFRQSYKNE